jgi:hypothetical protein
VDFGKLFQVDHFGYIIGKGGAFVLKKLPLKNIFIVMTALLVVPVMAFAMTTAVNPSDDAVDQKTGIEITSEDTDMDGTTKASPLIVSDGVVEMDGITSATGDPQNQGDRTAPDGVSSATGVSGENDDYDSDSDEDDEDEDHDAIKDDEEDDDDEDDDEEDDEEDDD